MGETKTKKIISYAIAIILILVVIVSAVIRCAFLIMGNYTAQLKQNLYDVSGQCAQTLETQLETRYNLLKSINSRFENMDGDRYDALQRFYYVVESFNLKRVGYVDVDGIAYATDMSGIDLSYRAFFNKSMNGEVYISDILYDALDKNRESVIVMSMPIYSNGVIEGVSCITYETDKLSGEMSVKSFDGHGDNFVINNHGNVVVSSDDEKIQAGKALKSANISVDGDEELIKKEFLNHMEDKSAFDGEFNLNGNDCYFQLTPVNIMEDNATWYILSIVPKDYLMTRFKSVERNLIHLVAIVLLIITAGIVASRYYYRKQRKITYSLAYESKLTGGPNLDKFFDKLVNQKNLEGYIVYMNLEDFTHTAIATGIEKSNELVKKIWTIIMEQIKPDEYAAHDKADCFAIYIKEYDDVALAERLQALRDKIHDEGHELNIPWVFAKFGVCRITSGNEVESAYSKAEYTAYDTWGTKEIVSFYNDEDHERQALNKAIEENFDSALEEENFEVWYQPKFNIDGNSITGAEALVRWRKMDGSLLPPGMFIPLLEKSGDIARLDEYVFEHACKHIKEWKDKGLNVVPVSINLSRATLYRDKIVERYVSIIEEIGVTVEDVQLEVTETIVGGSDKIYELLAKFRNLGIKILMDDFGSGYSALSTLNKKCFDTLKVDKSLVDEIKDEYGKLIISQTIELGNSLGLYITIEGVEDEEQLKLLHEMRCNDIQGYLFSKPLPEKEFEELLLKNKY